MSGQSLAGRAFEVDLGAFVVNLDFASDSQMRLVAEIGAGRVDETLAVRVATVRPDVHVICWEERAGNFVVQVHDHAAGIAHNFARLADGSLFQVEGRVRPVG